MEGAKVKYVNYPLPSDGATLKLSVSTGKAALYVSTTVTTPNETFYESTITTSDYKDVYLDPSTLAGSATIYIAIVGLEASNAVILSASGGDSSTGMALACAVYIAYNCTIVNIELYLWSTTRSGSFINHKHRVADNI